MELTKYEEEALREALEKHIPTLENHVRDLSKIKHATSEEKKRIKREIEKKIMLLKEIVKKL